MKLHLTGPNFHPGMRYQSERIPGGTYARGSQPGVERRQLGPNGPNSGQPRAGQPPGVVGAERCSASGEKREKECMLYGPKRTHRTIHTQGPNHTHLDKSHKQVKSFFVGQIRHTGQEFKMIKSIMYFVKEFLCVHGIAIIYL